MISRKFLREIFSVQNSDTHRIITVLRLKLKIKSNKLVKRKLMNTRREIEKAVSGFNNKNIVLYFDHSLGGGTEAYFNNQIRKDSLIIRVQYFLKNKHYKITVYDGLEEKSIIFNSRDLLFGVLDKIRFEKIVLNNIVGYPKVREILDYIAGMDCFVTLKLHDYYSVCPSWTLLNSENKYCGVETSDKVFEIPCDDIKKNFSILKWREMWGSFIKNSVDEVEIFSPSACQIFLKIYPFTKDKIKLIPHKIKPFPKYNIAILGELAINKGAKIIKELVKYFSYNNINDYHFILIGKNTKKIKSEKLTVLGEYKRDNLMNILRANSIDAILIPSIWPETFSYTTAEAIVSGYPVMCFGIGGQADQVYQYEKGKILSSFDPEIIEKEMRVFLENPGGKINETYAKISDKRQPSYRL